MAGRVLVLAVAAAALLSQCAAAPTDSRPRRHPTLNWMHRKLPPPRVTSMAGVEAFWFKQILDHFDSTNNETWDQLYFRNGAYYKPGGPVFLYISGESQASNSSVAGGFMFDLAVQHGALMLLLEHRFYGSSRPTEDMSTRNLRYLNSTQALEDLAHFIRQQRRADPRLASAKWVVFGGSYAGNLAAWARLRYPDIIDGAIASSAPVLAQANFPAVTAALVLADGEGSYSAGPECETMEECARQLNQPCPETCTYEYRPVDALCDKWKRIEFPNCCALRLEICEKRRNCTLLRKKEIPDSKFETCARQLRSKKDCPQACTLQYDPVYAWCGNKNKEIIEFPNCCALHVEICRNHRDCTLLHINDIPNTKYETCARQLSPKQDCPEVCTFEYDPVYAWCDNRELIKFPNCCALHVEICKNHRKCTLLRKKQNQPTSNKY